MTTATLTAPGTSDDSVTDWDEARAKYLSLDGAIKRKMERRETADDCLLLDMYGIVGQRLTDEETRLKGVAFRKPKAGNPEKFAAAVTAHQQAAEALDAKTKVNAPKISQLRAQLQTLERELADLDAKEKTAAKAVADMQTSRKHLEALLPSGLKSAINAMERPIRAKWQPKIAAANYALSMASIGASGNGKVGDIQDADSKVKALEADMMAELATVAVEFRDFYFDL